MGKNLTEKKNTVHFLTACYVSKRVIGYVVLILNTRLECKYIKIIYRCSDINVKIMSRALNIRDSGEEYINLKKHKMKYQIKIKRIQQLNYNHFSITS